MKRISFSLIFFILLLFSKQVLGDCTNFDRQNSNYYNFHANIKKLEVEVQKNRNWMVNSLKIAIGNFRFIPDEYKKNFKGTIKVYYKNGTICTHLARIRFSGDMKDHVQLDLEQNIINQSIDVNLNEGNILGITNFKLLLKRTRGEDEILISELLRAFGYLAPKTYLTDVNINNQNIQMLFQEKNRKELLERNNRREAPILEGDERFVWLLSQQVPSDQRSNYSAGLVPLIKTGFKSMLAKQKNSHLILRNENLEMMSLNVLTNLNKIYLKYSINFDENSEYIESYRYYTLDNEMLGFYNKDKIIFLDMYNLIVMASSDSHSLSPNNRQFYWNSFEHFFEPVSYDGNFKIFNNSNILIKPLSKYFLEAFINLEELFDNLDLNKLNDEINKNGLKQELSETKKKIIYLKANIENLKNKYIEELKLEKKYLEANLDDYIKNINKINKDIKFVNIDDGNELNLCNSEKICFKLNFQKSELAKIIQADYQKNNELYQFLGKNISDKNLITNINFKKKDFKDTIIYYQKDIRLNINEEKNIINIYQSKKNSKVFFLGGKIENLEVNFYGVTLENKNNLIIESPIDINGLTGCLTFINIKVNNLKLNSDYSNCEDAINFINSSGKINSITINNSLSDGLDADFSNLIISSIIVKNSQNDCSDFSYGVYYVINSDFANCGDKAISVGEKSKFNSKNIIIKNSLIGVASKDSSEFFSKKIMIENIKTCLTAYNKKQEFLGGSLKVEKISCKNYENFEEEDNLSIINILEKT